MEEAIVRIDADLQTRTEHDLGTLDAYDDWKFRAMRALNFRRREKNFLIQWVKQIAQEAAKVKAQESKAQRLTAAQMLVDELLKTATPYNRFFSNENPPTSLRQVNERGHILSDLKLEYVELVAHLKDRCAQLGFPPTFQGGGRHRIASVIQKIESELLLLKKFKRKSSEGDGLPDPLRGGGPHLLTINDEIRKIKLQLGMGSPEMTVWLFNLIAKERARLEFETEQEEKLGLIGQYVQLTLQRRKAEGNPLNE